MPLVQKIVLYDLSKLPTTFDFACTAVMAKSLGYEEVRFVVDKPMTAWKYPAKIGWRRWANILVPICELADLSFSVGSEMEGDSLGYTTGHVVAMYNQTKRIEKLKSIHPFDQRGYVTITMRESFRNAWRNSNKEEWKKVIEWLEKKGEKVILVDECEEQPIPIEYRMAVYMNAKMNLSVGNGPMVLCWLSEAPYLSFQLPNPPLHEKDYKNLVEQWSRMKFPVGSQLPWRVENQEIIWGPDDFKTITESFERVLTEPKAETIIAA